ncbi:MAG: DNA primase [Bacteroidetes bacterium]|nr:DNA primase [Bacteroidota bacterium]
MIKPETVNQIFERAHIEDVVGDFVHLKKRGANLLGLCPFHNEKTPSFTVSPAKGLYKCFGCGKGGNSVGFIMEHEHLSYPEALKFLARKYQIEVEEKELSPEEKEVADERESLMLITELAMKFFQSSMKDTDEGRSIALSYFKERGMDEAMIDRFALGYCPEGPENSFHAEAIRKGYKTKHLITTGLVKEGRQSLFDFFHGRVIFPIRGISGRAVGFGARTLRSDKSIAKYFNSPESIIYNKSKVLFGLYESKSAIVKKDLCYIAEGYMDVISMHQAGVENVVASSGTSLTVDQVRLIRRYTPNVTLIYDNDGAGIKASFRGIDILLEEGMKVRAVSLPDGDDPDSLSQRLGPEGMQVYLLENAKDAFHFMSDILLEKAGKDPIERSRAIKEIVGSLALFSDRIERNLKTQDMALRLGVDQKTLNFEIAKAQRQVDSDRIKAQDRGRPIDSPPLPDTPPPLTEEEMERDMPIMNSLLDYNEQQEQERDIIRILLNHGDRRMTILFEEDEQGETEEEISVQQYIMDELCNERHITFKDALYGKIWALYQSAFIEERQLDVRHLERHPDPTINLMVAELTTERHVLHRWSDRKIYPKNETEQLQRMADEALNRLRLRTVMQMMKETEVAMQGSHDPGIQQEALERLAKLNTMKAKLSAYFGSVIVNL